MRTGDGRPERDPSSDPRPYWITTSAFAEALVVSTVPWWCPRPGALRQTLETIGTLRNLEREGRLAITEAAAGGVEIGVALRYSVLPRSHCMEGATPAFGLAELRFQSRAGVGVGHRGLPLVVPCTCHRR